MIARAARLRQHRPTRSARGFVLVVVLVVIALLSLGAYSFGDLMFAEHRAARVSGRAAQARCLCDSGLEWVQYFLMQPVETQREAGGVYNNPLRMQGVMVVDDESSFGRGRFTFVAPAIDDEGNVAGLRYGLEDESTRLNLNILTLADEQVPDGGRTLLMALPGMTEDVADAILDWLDEDDSPREFGAEVDFYSGMSPAYAPKNGPVATVEELLLVRGVTPELLFGPDANRNGMIDPQEIDSGMVAGIDNADGSMTRGWSGYLTLHSAEHNLDPDGQPRIYLNAEDLEALYTELETVFGADWATFIVSMRQNGPYTGSNQGEAIAGRKPDFDKEASYTFTSLLDLIGSKVQLTFAGDDESTVLETPFPDGPLLIGTYLPALMDKVTVNQSTVIPGRINLNQASRTVLMGIPGMTEEIVTEILSRRDVEVLDENPARRHETWILTEAIVTLDEMRALLPYVTGAGHVYRAQVVGYFEDQGPAARVEATIDATDLQPRVVSWRNLSHLGRGYTVETLGVTASDY